MDGPPFEIHLSDLYRGFVNHTPGDMTENVCCTLDTTECPIERPRMAWLVDNFFFSEKFTKHTVKYEIAATIERGHICWVFGGMYGSLHDSRVLATSRFLLHLRPGYKVVADKGYIGIDPLRLVCQVKTPRTLHELVWNKCVGSVRAVGEQTFQRLKHLGMFSKPFRGRRLADHKTDFFNICHVQNIYNDGHPFRLALHPLLRSCPLAPPESLHYPVDDDED